MKRLRVMHAILLVVTLTGCSNHEALKPDQIKYKEKTLTYGTKDVDDVFFEDGIELKINQDNVVREIVVTSKAVETYNGVTVGDKIEKVKSKYMYEIEMPPWIMVLLDNTTEIDPSIEDKPDDAIWITYYSSEGVIDKIQIYDVTYGTMMK